jgi:PilZ domain-containing protein
MKLLAHSFLRDRRISERHNIKTALRVRMWKSRTPEQRAQSINLSDRGIFFATNSYFREGEAIEILLKMPQEISGEPAREWRCMGIVVRVQSINVPQGKLGVGVRFDCYEISPPPPLAESKPQVLREC